MARRVVLACDRVVVPFLTVGLDDEPLLGPAEVGDVLAERPVDVGADEAAFVEEVEDGVLEFAAGRDVAVGQVAAEFGLLAKLVSRDALSGHRLADRAAVRFGRHHRGDVGQSTCRERRGDVVQAADRRGAAGAVDLDAGDATRAVGRDGDIGRPLGVPREDLPEREIGEVAQRGTGAAGLDLPDDPLILTAAKFSDYGIEEIDENFGDTLELDPA